MGLARVLSVGLIGLFAALYTAGVLTGTVKPDRQLSAAHLALLAVSGAAVALLLRPDALRRITSLTAAGVSIEIEKIQQQVSETKREADETLQLLAEIFPLLLPNNVFQHLKNLAHHNTAAYWGTHALIDDLRSMRYMQLVESVEGRALGGIPIGARFDLTEWVRLTDEGAHWVERGERVLEMRQGH